MGRTVRRPRIRTSPLPDSSFSGTPDSDAGKISITGTLATGNGHELRILVAGSTQAWISDLTLPIAQVGVQHLGMTGEVGIEVDDPALRAKTRLMAYISGNVRGTIAVGQVRRIQSGIPGSTPSGNIIANVTSVGSNVPVDEAPPESPFGYVIAGNSISGTIKATLGSIDRVQVGPNTAAAGISGDIIAEAGAIKSIFSTGPIGNGTGTLMKISAANGIGQIRTAASDTGTILARRIEAEIVAHEAFLGPTPPTLNDPASDGVLSLLETAGDLHGTIHAANLTCDPDLTNCSGRRGIFVEGVCYAPITIDYIVSQSSIVARTFREPIIIGRVLQGMVVATGGAETPDPEPEGWMDGAIPWITVGRGALPSGAGAEYTSRPVGLNGFYYDRNIPTSLAAWFNQGPTPIDCVIHAEYVIGTASVRAMQHAKFSDTPPAIESPTIGELIVDYFSTGSIWSGQPDAEGHEESYAEIGSATIGCMRQGASLWVKAWGTLRIVGANPSDENPLGSDGNMFGSIHVPEVASAALVVIGAALADEDATEVSDTPDPRACHCAVMPDGSCQFAHWATNELYLMELPRNPWWPFSGAGGVPDRRGHVWIHENEKLEGQIIVNAANETVTPHEDLWTGAVQVGETTTGFPLIEVSPTPSSGEWTSPYYEGQGVNLGGGSVALIPAHLHEEDCDPPAESDPANYPRVLTSAFCGQETDPPSTPQSVTLDLYDGVYAALLAPSPVKVRHVDHPTTAREYWMNIEITRDPGNPFSRKVEISGQTQVHLLPGTYKVTPVMPADETANLTSMLCDGLLPPAGEVPGAPFEYYFVLVGDCNLNARDDAIDIFEDPSLDVWPDDGFIDGCFGLCNADVNCDNALDGFDVETQEKAVGGDMTDYCPPDPDFNRDFALDGFDIEDVETVFGGGPCP